MYQRNMQGWMKHLDFMLLDVLVTQFVYNLCYWFRHRGWVAFSLTAVYRQDIYRDVAVILVFATVIADLCTDNHRNILKRGYFREFVKCSELYVLIGLACIAYLFLVKQTQPFSRSVIGMLMVSGLVLLYVVRLIWKRVVLWLHRDVLTNHTQVVVVCPRDKAEAVLNRIEKNSHGDVKVKGLALIGEDAKGPLLTELCSVPVLCRVEDLFDYLQHDWVDELMIYQTGNLQDADWILDQCETMGLTAHLCLDFEMDRQTMKIIEKYCGYYVLTESSRIATQRQMFVKRLMDIVGGVIGLLLTVVLAVIIGPMIFISDPGPIIYAQSRKGRNGRDFKMYKFRSMYKDADERKAELMERNEMQGNMFKIEDDPRILGSGPDGKRKGLGWFIRKTSIDEFPQFWNVLKGDMSLVGTRPPTLDEWNKYELHHRARLSIRPGITGLWQVSGRSNITDFEEVVKLDLEYINNWSIGEDIKILLKTVAQVFVGSGAK